MTKKSEKKSKNILGKKESSILLFIVVIACIVFSSWGKPSIVKENASSGKALIGGAFELIDQKGEKFTSEQLKGKKSLVFFGFTSCPSICPAGLAQITAVLDKLGNSDIQPVFITVDPERDTPVVMAKYLKDFHKDFIGLTGSIEQLEAVKKAYKVYAAKAGDEGSHDYMMDHSSLIYFMDENGEYIAHFTGSETVDAMAAKIAE